MATASRPEVPAHRTNDNPDAPGVSSSLRLDPTPGRLLHPGGTVESCGLGPVWTGSLPTAQIPSVVADMKQLASPADHVHEQSFPTAPPARSRSTRPPPERERHCHVILSHLEPGFNALLTGLGMLADSGQLRLTQELRPSPAPRTDGPWHLRSKALSALELVVDGRSAHLDAHDSWEIDLHAYATHDWYFKRSLDPRRFPVGAYPKLRPLGLLTDVRADGVDRWEARRIAAQPIAFRQRAAMMLRFITHTAASLVDCGPRPNLALMHAAPWVAQEPRVLFMAGAWDPAQVPAEAPDKAAEFESINETRAACIRLLRREFGARFFGGLQHSEFARRRYPDVLLPQARAASKRAYLKRVRDYPVCVATTGLHGSNGWKLAEYVGLSRAIVTQRLRYAVPGEFAAPRNYLTFETADECVGQVSQLMQDATLRASQMQANQHYYHAWMRPDGFAAWVVNTIADAPRAA
jgi:hypothetical protein